MANVYGESGAWKSVAALLRQTELYAPNPDALRSLVPELEQDWINTEGEAEESFASQAEVLDRQATLTQTYSKQQIDQILRQYEMSKVEIVRQIAPAEHESRLRKMRRWFKGWHVKFQLTKLDKRRDAEIVNWEKSAADASNAALNFRNAKVDFITGFRAKSRARLDTAQRVLESPEFAGAVAELETQDYLIRLPDSYTVLADVCLDYKKYLYYEKEHLRTAQLDYVVVGPAGVFVIEVKRWSQKFTESGDYHDPYKQVARASYLCHRMLKESGLTTKCRTIIATRSTLPAKPPNSYAKVLPPNELCGYIQYFEQREGMDSRRVNELITVLRNWC